MSTSRKWKRRAAFGYDYNKRLLTEAGKQAQTVYDGTPEDKRPPMFRHRLRQYYVTKEKEMFDAKLRLHLTPQAYGLLKQRARSVNKWPADIISRAITLLLGSDGI